MILAASPSGRLKTVVATALSAGPFAAARRPWRWQGPAEFLAMSSGVPRTSNKFGRPASNGQARACARLAKQPLRIALCPDGYRIGAAKAPSNLKSGQGHPRSKPARYGHDPVHVGAGIGN